jgi:hypothetical protein
MPQHPYSLQTLIDFPIDLMGHFIPRRNLLTIRQRICSLDSVPRLSMSMPSSNSVYKQKLDVNGEFDLD